MVSSVSKWGNSLAVRIPKDALAKANIKEGDVVEIVSQSGRIVLVPQRDELTLDDLIERITPENVHAEQLTTFEGAEIW